MPFSFNKTILFSVCLAVAFGGMFVRADAEAGGDDEPLVYVGDDPASESDYIDGWHDGRIRPVIGAHNYQILRANRERPAEADGMGFTYNHAPDMAYWNGQFYCAWLNNPFGEHVPPGMTMYSTSADGEHWSFPRVLFPNYTYAVSVDKPSDCQDFIMHQRMVFYVAPDGRMLAFGFYGEPYGDGVGRVVREMYKDGDLGPVYFIRPNDNWEKALNYPMFMESSDAGFVAACQSFLDDPVRRMQWVEEDRFAKDADDFYRVARLNEDGDPGQAFCFYSRADGATVGLFKKRWATITRDGGQTWTPPSRIKSMTYDAAKIWCQALDNGTWAAVYNPSNTRARHPLAVAASPDGVHFDGLAFVTGEVPPKRYWGREKRPGAQYVHGISPGNGNPPGEELWVAYSMNKEDIWVAKIPTPARRVWEGPVDDDFDKDAAGTLPKNWHVYNPRWASSTVVEDGKDRRHSLRLSDRDPYDYACVQRTFAAGEKPVIEFDLKAVNSPQMLEIDVVDAKGTRLARLAYGHNGQFRHGGEQTSDVGLRNGKWTHMRIELDAAAKRYCVDAGGCVKAGAVFDAEGGLPERIIFRTGPYRLTDDVSKYKSGDEDKPGWDEPGAGVPVEESIYEIRDFSVQQ